MKKLLYLVITGLLCTSAFSQVCIQYATRTTPRTYYFSAPSVIAGLRISNTSGSCLTLYNCNNVIITNCVFESPSGEAIVLQNCTNVTITNCIFRDMNNGVYAAGSQGIKVNNNQFQNLHYAWPRSQFVQFVEVSGAGNEIMNNVGENIPGFGEAEDLINLYKSNGTAASPILVKGNKFRGGGPNPESSGGILTGDEGGSYVTVEDNILVDPGQYGIAIASGTNIRIANNKIFARQQPFTNVGIYVWNQYGASCGSNTVVNNEVNYTSRTGAPGAAWDAGNCGPVAGWDNNVWNASFTETILPQRLLCPELGVYYKFNNSWHDNTGNELIPVASNGAYTQFSCGADEGTARFNGINQLLTVPRNDVLRPTLQRISVSCWIKPANTSGIKGIARGQDGNGWENSWRMILNDDVFNPRITTDQGSAEVYCGGIQAGVWTLVTMTYDGKQLKGYVNGALQSTANLSGNILYYPSIQESMRIGFANGDYYFNGEIDEFRCYSGDLTAPEVASIYSQHSYIFNNNVVSPVFSSMEYYNNGQWYMGSYSNYVSPGTTDIYAYMTGQISSYTWTVLSGNPGLISYGNGATINLSYGDYAEISVMATNQCNASSTYTMFFSAFSFFTSSYSSASREIIVKQEIPKITVKGPKSNQPVKTGFTVQVFNTAGQLMQQAVSNQQQLRLNVSGLREGIYIIHITGNGQKQVKKVMITK